MNRLILRAGILFLTAAIGATLGVAADKESLRGIRELAVVIEPLGNEVEGAGLTVDGIRTDVELKLRLAGIKVLTLAESVQLPGSPFLYVNATVQLSKTNSGLATFAISVTLNQAVRLIRDGSITSLASTWHTGGSGSIGKDNLRQLRDPIKDHVDEFINDYLSVNPK